MTRLAMMALLAACSREPAKDVTLTLSAPVADERAATVSVEETETQINVLIDEPDLRVALVVPRVANIEPAIGYWREGEDFLVCKAELARDGAWLSFDGPCASGRVKLPNDMR